MYAIAIETLGCRLNQAETAVFARQFVDRGYRFVADPAEADLCIINTCTLTAQATAKCRRLVRAIVRRNPDACIAAVGCYAQTGADELRAIEGLDYIIGTADKMRLPEIIPSPVKLPEPIVVRGKAPRAGFTIDGAGLYPLHTRANLKIQEGCNFVCSFCIIPRSRGPARSRDFDDALREARLLVGEGHRELVITGVNIGTYNDRGRTLADLVGALEAIEGLERIRLSSIEPSTIETRLIDRMSRDGKLCPYLHIPLQSGDDDVLAQMRRKYTVAEYTRFVDDVRRRVPNIGLGTDVIVGMPGETDAAFQATLDMVERIAYTNVHVFSFSAREGTGAYGMAARVPGDVIAARSRALHEAAQRAKASTYEGQRGRTLRVLFEEMADDGRWVGFSDNYVRVAARCGEDLANRFGTVEIDHVALVGRSLRAVGALGDVEESAARITAHEMCATCGG